MPHIIIEYSHGLEFHFQELFKELHLFVSETVNTKVESCKSRAYPFEEYQAGDGSEAYVFAEVRLLSGRTVPVRKALTEGVRERIRKQLGDEAVPIAVAATEVDIETYTK